MMKRLLIGLVRVYQYAISPFLGRRCRYFPSCSNMPLKQYRNTVPARVAGWVPNASAAATPGILAGTTLYPDSRIFS
jgi:hypothetical protein